MGHLNNPEKIRRLALILAGIFLAVGLAFRMAEPPRLLERATPVPGYPITLDDSNNVWNSPHSLLNVEGNHTDSGFQITQIDTVTGRETSLDALNKNCLAQSVPVNESVSSLDSQCRLSPDGNWLLWIATPYFRKPPNQDTGACWYAASLKNPRLLTQPVLLLPDASSSNDQYVWTPNSQEWIDFSEQGSSVKVHIYSVKPHTPVRTVQIMFPPSPNDVFPLGFNPQGQMIVGRGDMTHVSLYKVNLNAAFSVAKQSVLISFPKDTEIAGIKLSPAGDRLAWRVIVWSPSPVLDLLHHLVTAIPNPPHFYYEILTSRLDGSEKQEIGETAQETWTVVGDADNLMPDLYNLQWTPDGKRLSFNYRGTLYTVPAN